MATANQAAIHILRDFITMLMEAGLSKEDAMRLAFDMAVDLVPFVEVTLPMQVTPEEAEIRLHAAALLKEAALSFLN